MPIDKTIFSHRFPSNEKLRPTQSELRTFLESPKKNGLREPQKNDLAKYTGLAKSIHAFKHQPRDSAPRECGEKMLYGVLNHSQFVKPGLQSAVEHYKYYNHLLQTLDFKKPMTFITSAEEEMGRLALRKKDNAVKLARFQEMVDDRKKMLRVLHKRWAALDEEMVNIVRYIRNNLVKVAKLCEMSMGILMNPQSSQKIEQQTVEDLKTHFKEQLRNSLRRGTVTPKNLEAVKHEVSVFSLEIASLLREDVNALMKLYDAILDHVTKIADELDGMIENIEGKLAGNLEEDREFFTRVEEVLVSLVSGYQPEVKKTILHTATAHEKVLQEKRAEMLDLLFELLQKERRSQRDRRSHSDRRRFSDRTYRGPERRSGNDRRSGEERRAYS